MEDVAAPGLHPCLAVEIPADQVDEISKEERAALQVKLEQTTQEMDITAASSPVFSFASDDEPAQPEVAVRASLDSNSTDEAWTSQLPSGTRWSRSKGLPARNGTLFLPPVEVASSSTQPSAVEKTVLLHLTKLEPPPGFWGSPPLPCFGSPGAQQSQPPEAQTDQTYLAGQMPPPMDTLQWTALQNHFQQWLPALRSRSTGQLFTWLRP